jgi:hypothetical protein
MRLLISATLVISIAAGPLGAQEKRHRLDPELSYKMSRDGWFWQWGNGHLYNGEHEEARAIWWKTMGWHALTWGGILGASVALAQSPTTKKNKDARQTSIVLFGLTSLAGQVGYTIQRNRDISTAPLHAVSLNLQFGGVGLKKPEPKKDTDEGSDYNPLWGH